MRSQISGVQRLISLLYNDDDDAYIKVLDALILMACRPIFAIAVETYNAMPCHYEVASFCHYQHGEKIIRQRCGT